MCAEPMRRAGHQHRSTDVCGQCGSTHTSGRGYPDRLAVSAASSARVETPSLAKTWLRCVETVRGETNSLSATCLLDNPSATSWTTWRSVGVRLSQPVEGR